MLDALGRWLQRCLNWVGRFGARLFMPRVGRLVEEELRSDAYDGAGDEPECVRIEDVGADTTIFSFSRIATHEDTNSLFRCRSRRSVYTMISSVMSVTTNSSPAVAAKGGANNCSA